MMIQSVICICAETLRPKNGRTSNVEVVRGRNSSLQNIYIGNNFTGNFNLTILDIREVYIGDNVMIGSGTLITTVGHSLSPMGRRKHLGIAKPVRIGNYVWIGGNVTVLPGVMIGNNAVVAAGAVVTKDIPDNCVVGGVPARRIKDIEDDTGGIKYSKGIMQMTDHEKMQTT